MTARPEVCEHTSVLAVSRRHPCLHLHADAHAPTRASTGNAHAETASERGHWRPRAVGSICRVIFDQPLLPTIRRPTCYGALDCMRLQESHTPRPLLCTAAYYYPASICPCEASTENPPGVITSTYHHHLLPFPSVKQAARPGSSAKVRSKPNDPSNGPSKAAQSLSVEVWGSRKLNSHLLEIPQNPPTTRAIDRLNHRQ